MQVSRSPWAKLITLTLKFICKVDYVHFPTWQKDLPDLHSHMLVHSTLFPSVLRQEPYKSDPKKHMDTCLKALFVKPERQDILTNYITTQCYLCFELWNVVMWKDHMVVGVVCLMHSDTWHGAWCGPRWTRTQSNSCGHSPVEATRREK